MKEVHLNCDLGEGFPHEEVLFPFISACSIACGGHAGTLESMQHSVDHAIEHHVSIGAHPAYPDKAHFGRRPMDLAPEDLHRSLMAQILSLKQITEAEGAELSHIKLHGALYHQANADPKTARVIMEVLEDFEFKFPLYVSHNSEIAKLASGKNKLLIEAFGDRRYEDSGALRPRQQEGALLTHPEEVLEQVLLLVEEKRVKTSQGGSLFCDPDTICIHGDNPNVQRILKHLQQGLQKRNIQIKKYV